MRKLIFLAALIMVSLVCCRKEKFDTDLLYGSWIMESGAGHPRPMIDFNTGGDYCLIDYVKVPAGGVAVYRYTITGDFEIEGHFITLVTAEVQTMDEEPDPGGFPYEGIDVTEGVPLGSFYGSQGSDLLRSGTGDLTGIGFEYTPVTWKVLDLTESLLEVKVALDTVRYVRH